MLDLLYLSRTVVPAHLGELEQLDLLYRDEQVLIALDGVLLDGQGCRLSGPTLHDYCLLTGNRVLLWARDYAEHTCYAFPLSELWAVSGQGMDPLHAQLQLTFQVPDEEPQQFTLALLPLADLSMALALFSLAAQTARDLETAGATPLDLGGEVAAVLSAKLFGDVEAPVQQNPRLRNLAPPPYRWKSASAASPGPSTSSLETAPEMVYTLGRVGRSAWDTLIRSVRSNELPFDVSGVDMRDLTSLMRAANDLLSTIASSPEARETVIDLFTSVGPEASLQAVADGDGPTEDEPPSGGYREIPLRRREMATPDPACQARSVRAAAPAAVDDSTDFRGIPLRRRKRASGE